MAWRGAAYASVSDCEARRSRCVAIAEPRPSRKFQAEDSGEGREQFVVVGESLHERPVRPLLGELAVAKRPAHVLDRSAGPPEIAQTGNWGESP